mmetsp:Transcript_104214/g.201857  ORF Transcript_104214/g.201857 Transcript_104214/m.201857 type:complete len:270 (+) Transcript_104214:514-1323(+)
MVWELPILCHGLHQFLTRLVTAWLKRRTCSLPQDLGDMWHSPVDARYSLDPLGCGVDDDASSKLGSVALGVHIVAELSAAKRQTNATDRCAWKGGSYVVDGKLKILETRKTPEALAASGLRVCHGDAAPPLHHHHATPAERGEVPAHVAGRCGQRIAAEGRADKQDPRRGRSCLAGHPPVERNGTTVFRWEELPPDKLLVIPGEIAKHQEHERERRVPEKSNLLETEEARAGIDEALIVRRRLVGHQRNLMRRDEEHGGHEQIAPKLHR